MLKVLALGVTRIDFAHQDFLRLVFQPERVGPLFISLPD
jgi:hypothetical protein